MKCVSFQLIVYTTLYNVQPQNSKYLYEDKIFYAKLSMDNNNCYDDPYQTRSRRILEELW